MAMALPELDFPHCNFHRYPDKEFQVGLAEDDMGPALGKFLNENGMDFGGHPLKWDKVYPYWSVAIREDGEILGAMNIVHSLPVGRLELLVYKQDLSDEVRRQIIHELSILGIATLVANGSALGAGTVSESDPRFLGWLEARGATTAMTDGHILLMRFPDGLNY
jgi:hypothetical protein